MNEKQIKKAFATASEQFGEVEVTIKFNNGIISYRHNCAEFFGSDSNKFGTFADCISGLEGAADENRKQRIDCIKSQMAKLREELKGLK